MSYKFLRHKTLIIYFEIAKVFNTLIFNLILKKSRPGSRHYDPKGSIDTHKKSNTIIYIIDRAKESFKIMIRKNPGEK